MDTLGKSPGTHYSLLPPSDSEANTFRSRGHTLSNAAFGGISWASLLREQPYVSPIVLVIFPIVVAFGFPFHGLVFMLREKYATYEDIIKLKKRKTIKTRKATISAPGLLKMHKV